MKIKVATTRNAPTNSKSWYNATFNIGKLKDRHVDTITHDEYLKLSPDERTKKKEAAGGFLGGELVDKGPRSNQTVLNRTMLTFDLDDIPSDDNLKEILENVSNMKAEYIIYSTRSHLLGKPRIRILFPLAEPIAPEKYEPVMRKVATLFGIEYVASESYKVSQFMYYPTVSSDQLGNYIFMNTFDNNEYQLLNGDSVLEDYTREGKDWRDALNWDYAEKDIFKAGKSNKKTRNGQPQDPSENKGIAGAFCSVYNVEEAIAEFIPDRYEPGTTRGRLTYTGGSDMKNGVVLLDDGDYIYSHHNTDPIGGQSCNAFEMLRLHLFGHLDDDLTPQKLRTIKPSEFPSYRAMRDLVNAGVFEGKEISGLKEVKKEHLKRMGSEETPFGASVGPESSTKDSEAISTTSFIPVVPEGYVINNFGLCKLCEDNQGNDALEVITRHPPILTRELVDIEDNTVNYEIAWNNGRKNISKIIPNVTLASGKELLPALSRFGFNIIDENKGEIVSFLDKFKGCNNIPSDDVVSRLGWVNGHFVDPYGLCGVTITPQSKGEEEILNSFQTNGTIEEWKVNVFDKVKNYAKPLAMMLATFSSVVLSDLRRMDSRITPTIVHDGSPSGSGKSTTQKACVSIFGTRGLILEWNTTRTAIEFMSGFLNSFPLFLDDTNKAPRFLLPKLPYHFSGGRGKSRGNVNGGIHDYKEWCNVLISNGENSFSEYLTDAGELARVLDLKGYPYPNITREEVQTIDNNSFQYYGQIGKVFIQNWQQNKDEYLEKYREFAKEVEKKYANQDVTFNRLLIHFTVLLFTGKVLNHMFDFNINLELIETLIVAEQKNDDHDRFKTKFIELLDYLDTNRNLITLDHHSNRSYANPVWGVFREKDRTFYLTIGQMNAFLAENKKSFRKKWEERGYIIEGVKRANIRCVAVNPDLLAEMGYDFSDFTSKEDDEAPNPFVVGENDGKTDPFKSIDKSKDRTARSEEQVSFDWVRLRDKASNQNI